MLFPISVYRHPPTARGPPHKPEHPWTRPPPPAQAHPQLHLPTHSSTEHRPCPTDTPNRRTMCFMSPSKRTLPNPFKIFTLKLFLKKPSYINNLEFCTLTILQPIQHQILLTVTIYDAISFEVKPVNYTLKLTLLCFFSIKSNFL